MPRTFFSIAKTRQRVLCAAGVLCVALLLSDAGGAHLQNGRLFIAAPTGWLYSNPVWVPETDRVVLAADPPMTSFAPNSHLFTLKLQAGAQPVRLRIRGGDAIRPRCPVGRSAAFGSTVSAGFPGGRRFTTENGN